MSEAFNNRSIDTELQVRLMNLVMGEASDFERDQLQRLMEQRVELTAYYQHLEHLHGFLCEVGAGDSSIDVDPTTAVDAWQISTDRREHLLAVLDGKNKNAETKVVLASSTSTKPQTLRSRRLALGVMATAACVLLGMMLPSIQSNRSVARKFYKGSSEGTDSSFRTLQEQNIAGSSRPSLYYLEDDVQYYPNRPDTNGQSYRDLTTGKPSGLEDRNIPNGVAAFERSASGPSAPNSRFARPSAQPVAPEVAGLPMIGEKQAGGVAGTSFDVTQGYGGYGMGGGSHGGIAGDMGGMGGPLGGSGHGLDFVLPSESASGGGASSFRLETRDGNRDKSLAYDFGNKPQSGTGLAVDDFRSEGKAGRAAVDPAKSNSQWIDNGLASSLSNVVESPKSEVSRWEGFNSDRTRATVEVTAEVAVPIVSAIPVPDGGSILLGEVRGTREIGQHDGFDVPKYMNGDAYATSNLMMTVTPRIVIPEEEAEVVGVNSRLFGGVAPADGEQQATIRSDGSSPPIAYPTADVWQQLDVRRKDRYGSVGAEGQVQTLRQSASEMKKSTVAEKPEQLDRVAASKKKAGQEDGFGDQKKDNSVEPMSAIVGKDGPQINTDLLGDVQIVPADSTGLVISKGSESDVKRVDELIELFRESKRGEVARSWMIIPPTSPESASSDRSGIKAEGKLAAPKQPITVAEQFASTEAFSTFSLHVSDVSFKLAQTALSQGQWPEAAKIRIEEFVNAIDYHDPLPSGNQKVACRIEQAIHPFLMQRNLLRVSMRTAATGRSQNTPLRLTLLLDNSGSMERPDRRQAVLRAFQTLTQQLSATDQITLISFASTPRLLADKVRGNQCETLLQRIENLPSEGGTNIEAALLLAREKAAEQQLVGAQNRIVLLTDGAVNLGNANPESLAKLVTQMRDAGIAFDAAGISALDLNDKVLETLTRNGDGRYYLLDSAAAAGEAFAAQIAGALRPSAKNVKVQVEFNPLRVGRYKLLGFEKHLLNKEDFRNDQVDAAEMAAAETGVALYHFEIKPNGSGDVGSVSVRFRDLSTGQMVERRWPIPYESNAPRLEQAESSMQLAAIAALFAAKLGGGPLSDSVDLSQLQKLLAKLPEQFGSQPRVQQLRAMIEQALDLRPKE